MNMYLGRMDEALRFVEQMKTFALDYNEHLELEFMMLLTTGQLVSAEVVGKRLAEVLNKEAPNVAPTWISSAKRRSVRQPRKSSFLGRVTRE